MRFSNITKFILLVFILSIMGCSTDTELPQDQIQEVDASAKAAVQFNFTTSLKGDNEVPSNDSKATGQAIVKISKDETYLEYKLIVANIDDVLMAHFHMAPAGTNGGFVVWLYGPSEPSGDFNGVLAEGVITEDDVINALDGDFQALIDAIRAGNIYVNVHTTEFPGGELRGQL
ncbi:CHRD domain-containing protein [Gramella jeungdoensis]|uniref:CHRD domain-containing protein n=1 Tax=Gramella jeungdoensis TaxID=708091 RepID=A0ABT0Z306_9FLAO|nr:CHRD domain-containing protein [Gramella jeungdoensis]MCM8570121.1 CHRD domain-containing protein [Gramella jeungdoensis]